MTVDWSLAAGTLEVTAALERPHLLADPVIETLRGLTGEEVARVGVAEIDPDAADTAEFCQRYASPRELSANCVVVAGKRGGDVRHAACLILSTTRADINGVVKRWLGVRKASFAAVDEAVRLTGMKFGGITPFGLPAGWPILIDVAVAHTPAAVVGSGLRRSKIITSGEVLANLPGTEIVGELAQPVT